MSTVRPFTAFQIRIPLALLVLAFAFPDGASAEWITIRLTPVATHPDGEYAHGGAYTDANIFGQELRVRRGGFTAFFNVQLDGWGPYHRIRSWQARIDATTYLGQNADPPAPGVDLTYPVVPCDSSDDCSAAFGEEGSLCVAGFCRAAWIAHCRDDAWVWPCACQTCTGCKPPVWDLGLGSPKGPLFFATTSPGDPANGIFCAATDHGAHYYGASLALYVPPGAKGRYTVKLLEQETFVADDSQPVTSQVPINVVDAVIYIIGDDCNNNAQPDDADILLGISQDVNGDGTPDECDGSPHPQDAHGPSVRYIAFTVPRFPGTYGEATALRVRLSSLHHPQPPNDPCCPSQDFSAFEGQYRYVKLANAGTGVCPDSTVRGTTFHCATLTCDPTEPGVYLDWPVELEYGVLYVTGSEIVPSSRYEISQLALACAGHEDACLIQSPSLQVLTARWGDVDGNGQLSILDVAAEVDKVKDLAGGTLIKPLTQLGPNAPDPKAGVTVLDIARTVDAVKGLAYLFPGPGPCP
ncbi:MAG: hypothetical protein AABZ12_14725 [Planctomycetota bacterium]